MAKINVSIDDELLARLDKVADDNYMSRSGLISAACIQYISGKEVIRAITDMSLFLKKISDQGTVDEETMKQLADMERVCKMLVGK